MSDFVVCLCILLVNCVLIVCGDFLCEIVSKLLRYSLWNCILLLICVCSLLYSGRNMRFVNVSLYSVVMNVIVMFGLSCVGFRIWFVICMSLSIELRMLNVGV